MKKKLFKMMGVAVPIVMVLALAISLVPAHTSTADAAVGKLRFETIPVPKIGSAGKYVLTPGTDVGPVVVSPDGSTLFAGDVSTITTNVIGVDPGASATSINITDTSDFRASGVVCIEDELVFYGSIDTVQLLECTRGYGGTTAATHAAGKAVTEKPMAYKSTDGGYTWSLTGLSEEAFNDSLAASDNTCVVDIGISPEYASDSSVYIATQKFVYQSTDGGKTFGTMNTPTAFPATAVINDMDVTLDAGGRLSVIIGTTAATYTGEVYVYSPETTGMSWKAQSIGATRNALGVAFSPNFAADEGIFAVTTNNTTAVTNTEIRCSFGYTKTGGGWDLSGIGDGEFLDKEGNNIIATRARIGFPVDFDVDSIMSNIAWVGLVADTSNGLNTVNGEEGDVFQVTFQPTKSSTVDLNVRGLISTLRTATNIWDIAVTGPADAANILVGTDYWSTGATNYYWTAYYSNDSGASWSHARTKSPTGGALGTASPVDGIHTTVALSSDFDTNEVAYAATTGAETSALSRTSDGGKSWNQISLIYYANATAAQPYRVRRYGPDAGYATNGKAYMLTTIGGNTGKGAVWLTENAGATYERILSFANPTVDPEINNIKTTKPAGTLFVIDYTNGKFWRSSDGGATWPTIINAKEPTIGSYDIADSTTLYTIHSNGHVWSTTQSGRPWVEPDESQISGVPTQYKRQGDIHIVSTESGKIFISTDAGNTFTKTLGLTDLPAATGAPRVTTIVFDSNFDSNHFVYASSIGTAGWGVWRIEINEDDPGANEWKQIDATSTGYGTVKGGPTLMFGGVLYIPDGATVNTTAGIGGLWRCVNPSADIDGIFPPEFKNVNTGLANGSVVGFKGPVVKPPYAFFMVNGSADYDKQVVAISDTLSTPVELLAPADKAKGEGVSLSTTDLTLTVIMSWKAVSGATAYRYQVANDMEFNSLVVNTTTTGQQKAISDLIPGKPYYWRVRVDEPLLSPWSSARDFTIGTATEFLPTSPAIGATGVDIMPTLTWNEYEGAIGYEVTVAEDSTFAILDFAYSSTSPFIKVRDALAYDTTYYWRVRGVTGPAVMVGKNMVAPTGPWVSGIFTTMAKPVVAQPPVIIEKEPAPPAEIKIVEIPAPAAPAAIPAYLLWTVIIIGAILIIALIVLIVRTRRVT